MGFGVSARWFTAPSIFFLLSACVPLAAQSPATVTKSPKPATRISTHLVQVSVVAVDRHGRPVSGLTRDDFVVLDEGKPQSIGVFYEERPRPAATAAPPLPTGTFSNSMGVSSADPQTITVILLDQLNTTVQDQMAARDQLIRFLKRNPPPGPIALYRLTDHLTILLDFTFDREALSALLSRYQPSESTNRFAGTPKPSATGLRIDGFENFIREREARFYMPERRVRPTVGAISAIAERLANTPGRKNLIWLSGSFPIAVALSGTPVFRNFFKDAATYDGEVEKLGRQLSAANISIYPVDARGVPAPDTNATDTVSAIAPIFRGALGPAGTMDAATTAAVTQPDFGQVSTMEQIADATGGRAFTGSNDIAGELSGAFEDARQNYMLGFYPDQSRWDGKFHSLRVQVKKPGVRVRARKGYLAIADDILDSGGRQQQLQLAATSPLDASAIGFEVVARKTSSPENLVVTARMMVAATQLTFLPLGDGWSAEVQLVFVQSDGSDRPLETLQHTIRITLRKSSYELALRNGLRLTSSLPIRSDAKQFRVLLQDAGTGAVGSVTVPLAAVPALD
jgi:VWFA-related protein